MELPIVTAKKLIATGNFTWIDELYFGQIPAEADTTGTKTIVLVTSVTEPFGKYNNDSPSVLDATVQVQIFFEKDTQMNVLDAQLQLVNLFIQDDWQLSNREPNVIDPDTNQVTALFYASKNFTLTLN